LILDTYDIDILDEESLIDILREGAEQNSLNRISQKNITKLAKTLQIPLDDTED